MAEERLPLPLLGFPDDLLECNEFEITYQCFGDNPETNVVIFAGVSDGVYEVHLGREPFVFVPDLLTVVALIEDYRQRKGL